jgi:hypothetical protein
MNRRHLLQAPLAAWAVLRGIGPEPTSRRPGHVYVTTEPEFVGRWPERGLLPIGDYVRPGVYVAQQITFPAVMTVEYLLGRRPPLPIMEFCDG